MTEQKQINVNTDLRFKGFKFSNHPENDKFYTTNTRVSSDEKRVILNVSRSRLKPAKSGKGWNYILDNENSIYLQNWRVGVSEHRNANDKATYDIVLDNYLFKPESIFQVPAGTYLYYGAPDIKSFTNDEDQEVTYNTHTAWSSQVGHAMSQEKHGNEVQFAKFTENPNYVEKEVMEPIDEQDQFSHYNPEDLIEQTPLPEEPPLEQEQDSPSPEEQDEPEDEMSM